MHMTALREYNRLARVWLCWAGVWYCGMLGCHVSHMTAETVLHYSSHTALYSLQPLTSCENGLKLPLSALEGLSENHEVS